ncbi:MAG: para-nitrobenzyl esterase [Crocinitomix sp.]|jgi:para-nitrobenzyl esterase
MYNKILTIFIILTLSACKKDDETVIVDPDPDTPTLELEYSESPIDLGDIDANFVKNIPYDSKSKTKFDIFLPNSVTPTALVIYTHGGGFLGGTKENAYLLNPWPDNIRDLLANNIAFATISYSLLEEEGEEEGIIKALHDVRRALQFIRYYAVSLNLDKSKVVLSGGSAGAGTSLWIAFNDDMKDLTNSDPVLKESTRVLGVALSQTQSSYDLEERYINDVFDEYSLSWDDMVDNFGYRIFQFYGVTNISEYNTPEIDAYRNTVDMLGLMSADDPELWVSNTGTDVIYPSDETTLNHHAYHARALKERADLIGIPNVCYYGKDPIIYSDPSGEDFISFCIRKLTE